MSVAELRKKLTKPKTKRAKRALEEKAPKFIENVKQQLLLRGTKTSPIINEILKDLHRMKNPHSKSLMRRNEKRPFEDFSSIQFLSDKNDCSLFSFGRHSKKRPNTIIMGRTFDYNLLDMYEFSIDNATYKSIDSFSSITDHESSEPSNKSFNIGSKPALLFQGESFQNDPILKEVRGFFVDYFQGVVLRKFNLLALDHVIVFTVINPDEISLDKQKYHGLDVNDAPIVFLRHYKIEYQTSAHNKLPFVHLKEIGPSMDMRLLRYDHGNDEIRKKSMQIAKVKSVLDNKPKQKNVFLDPLFKERRGKIFIDHSQQNLNKMKVKKMKALRDHKKGQFRKKQPKKKKNSNNKKVRMRQNQMNVE